MRDSKKEYLKRKLIRKICQCGCKKIFFTKYKSVKFIKGHKYKKKKITKMEISKTKFLKGINWKFQIISFILFIIIIFIALFIIYLNEPLIS